MITNRSVPPDTLLPHVIYQNIAEAIAWLNNSFGFVEQYRYGAPDAPDGAQVRLGKAWVMLRTARPGSATPAQTGFQTQSLTIFVDDVAAHLERAKAAGARIVEDLNETFYGERQYGAEDLAGHRWLFAQHVKDVSPEEWGATVFETASPLTLLRRPRFCYLEIPAVDVQQSVSFYEKVFGWNIRRRDSDRPSFDDATGDVSGAWVTGRKIAGEPGLLPYIWVADSVDATLTRVIAHGGAVVENPRPDHPGSTSWIATFRDPAGNLIGLYQENVGQKDAG